MVCPRGLNGVQTLSLDMLKKPAQGQCFGIYQTTNPKP